jgi:hypothetical protein
MWCPLVEKSFPLKYILYSLTVSERTAEIKTKIRTEINAINAHLMTLSSIAKVSSIDKYI